MNEETKAVIEEVTKGLGDLRSVFAPILPEALAVLDGWTWRVENKSDRTIINRGEEVDVFPIIQRGKTQERGWIITFGIIFSDPDTEIVYSMDNWAFAFSPRALNILGQVLPNNNTVYNNVFNAASPLGPIYGIVWNPAKFWPYKTQIVFRARHPRTALTATSQIVAAGIGRQYISDEKLFYESIFIESQKQTIGRVQVPIRRPI